MQSERITRHGVELRPTWFDRQTFSAQLGFCTDDGVRDLERMFIEDGARTTTDSGYVLVFVKVEA